MMTKAACRFCGQIILIDDIADETEAEEQATLQCKCDGAKHYKNRLAKIEKAQDNIELALYKVDEKVCEYMKQCVDLVESQRIASITVDTGTGVKCSVRKTTKGTIKVVKKISKDVIYDE